MDPPVDRAAASSSTRRQSRPKRPKRKSPVESPLSSLQSTNIPKNKKRKKNLEVYYTVKGILKERKQGDLTEFLIDWADNPITGETYEPSWEPEENVTAAAINEWNSKTSNARLDKRPSRSTSENSELVRPARRSRTTSSIVTTPRRQEQVEDSQPTNTEQLTGANYILVNKAKEIKDSYEDEDSSAGSNFRVEIPINNDFNTDEYILVGSSQLSDFSQTTLQSPSQSQTQPRSQAAVASRIRGTYIWDEDIVPDSQYSSGSTSYKASVPPTSLDHNPSAHSGIISRGNVPETPNIQISSSNYEISTPIGSSVIEASEALSNTLGSITNSAQPENPDRNRIIADHNNSFTLPTTTIRLTITNNSFHENSQLTRKKPSPELSNFSKGVKHSSNLISIPDSLASNQTLSTQVASQHIVHKSNDSIAANEQQVISDSLPVSVQKSQDVDSLFVTPTKFSTQEPIHSQQSLEIPDSISVHREEANRTSRDSLDKSCEIVNTVARNQNRAASWPTNNPEAKTPEPDSQRSQSLPIVAQFGPSQEETWQGAQIVSPIVQVSNTQGSGVTSTSQVNLNPLSLTPKSDKNNNQHQDHIESSQVQPSTTSPLNTDNLLQVRSTIEIETDLDNTQIPLQETTCSQDFAELTRSHSHLPPRPSPIISDMENISPAARLTKSRSPSAIPPQATPQVYSNQLLPLRDNIGNNSRPRNMAPSSTRVSIERAVSSPNNLTVIPNPNQDAFVVPLPMMNAVRDVYDLTIKNKREEIVSFLREPTATSEVSYAMDMMIEELKLICDHQDLIVEESSTQDLDDNAQARYAVTISTKFLFVRQFLDTLRTAKVHVVILAREAILPILESLFKSQDYTYNRPDAPGNSNDSSKDLMQITLLPTWIDVRDCLVAPASVVLAFDSSSQGEEQYCHILPNPRNPKPAPLLSLVITHSVEHLELCITTAMDSLERKERLLECIAKTRKKAGILPPHYLGPEQAATSAAKYILSDPTTAIWSLLPMPSIELPVQAGLGTHPSHSVIQSCLSPLEQNAPTGSKRPPNFDNQEQDTLIKRQRLTPTRQITDASFQLMNATTPQFHQQIKSLEARCQDYENSLKRIQPKYQHALNEQASAVYEKNKAIERELKYQKKLEQQLEANTKLRDENTSLKSELSAAKEALANSTNPSIAELQKAKDDLGAAHGEIERLKKSLQRSEEQIDYTRTQYQQNSFQVQELRNELSVLQEEVVPLRAAASSTRMEIQTKSNNSLLKQQNDIIAELRREMSERDKMLEKSNEKLEALLNGRRTTRGTSVPRSPRMGMANMSPRPRVMGSMGPSSRGGSPAPGGLGAGFGGELPVAGRFSHLHG